MTTDGTVVEVTGVPLGDELAAAALVAATSITVDDAADFDENGGTLVINGQVIVYTACDDETGIITLAEGLDAAAAVGDRVELWDVTQAGVFAEWVARVELAEAIDNDDVVEATVAHTLVPYLPEGIRNPGEGEDVTLELDGYEWKLVGIDARNPVLDGTFLDPASLPGLPIPDGLAPPAVTTLQVVGGRGFISVRWDGVANPDNQPVRYELHMSESSSLVPVFNDPATLVLDTNSNLVAAVDALPPDNDPLMYFVPDPVTGEPTQDVQLYYFSVISYDADGDATPSPAFPGSMNQTVAADIAVRSLTGELLAAELVLGSLIATPGTTGARVELHPEGFHVHAADDEPLVIFPVDGSTNFFKGEASINVATIAQLLLSGTGHQLTPGSTLTLTGSTQAPSQQPTVTGNTYGTQTLDEDDFNDLKRGFWYDSASDHYFYGLKGFGPFPVQGSITEVDRNGATIGVHLPDDGIFILGIVKQGTDWWILGEDQNGVLSHDPDRFIVGRYNSSFVLQNSWTADLTGNPDADPAFGYDAIADRLMIAYTADTGQWRIDKFQRHTTGAIHSADSTHLSSTDYGGTAALAAVFRGSFDLGTDRHIMVAQNISGNQANVRVMTASTIADVASEYWPIANGAHLAGMTWDGNNFYHLSINGSLGNIVKYSDNFWTTEPSKWWVKNTLYDGTFETDPSPARSLTMTKRGRLVVSAEVPVGDADQIRVYVGRGSTLPSDANMFRQTDPGVGNNLSAKYDEVVFSGNNLGTARTPFPAGSLSDIAGADGTAIVDSESFGWKAYTPTLSNWTLGNGTLTGRYCKIGKLICFYASYTVGSTDTKSGNLVISIPENQAASWDGVSPVAWGSINDTSASDRRMVLGEHAGGGVEAVRFRQTGTTGVLITNTVPWTWATGDSAVVVGLYETD